MPDPIPGIHHITAVGSNPGRNLEFYTETLGLRLVKRSVNQDDHDVYHLFYGDYQGSPGTCMTVFPYPNARRGQVGTGQVNSASFLIPAEAFDFWRNRLMEAETALKDSFNRFGNRVLSFEDPDGLPLELVAREDVPTGNPPDGPIPKEHAIRGFFGVTIAVERESNLPGLLEEMGYRRADGKDSRTRYKTDGELGYVIDIRETPNKPPGRPGAGTIHHIAFQVTTESQPEWRQTLIDRGLRPTNIIDRTWFESVYVRLPSGPLFEFATAEPGYTVDEPLEELGESLVLPAWLAEHREEIVASLPELESG